MAQEIETDPDIKKQLEIIAKKLKEILVMTPSHFDHKDPIIWMQLKKMKEFKDMHCDPEKPNTWTLKF